MLLSMVNKEIMYTKPGPHLLPALAAEMIFVPVTSKNKLSGGGYSKFEAVYKALGGDIDQD